MTFVVMANMRQFPPRRIVCLTEETVETLYLIGEEDRIVGVSGYAVRPPRVRREKPRVSAFISADIPKILALEPEIVLPSHGEPIEGRDKIVEKLTRYRNAILYVHDATVKGMNEGKDVFTLMHEIKLPPGVAVAGSSSSSRRVTAGPGTGAVASIRASSVTEGNTTSALSLDPSPAGKATEGQ